MKPYGLWNNGERTFPATRILWLDPGKPIPGQPVPTAARRRRTKPDQALHYRPDGDHARFGQSLAASPTPIVQLDATDIRILNLLQEDGEAFGPGNWQKGSTFPPHRSMNVSKDWESSGIIDHYSAVVNTGKIGQFIVFFVNIVLKEHSTLLTNEFTQSNTSLPRSGGTPCDRRRTEIL